MLPWYTAAEIPDPTTNIQACVSLWIQNSFSE